MSRHNWRANEDKMFEELNQKVFSEDPILKSSDKLNSVDTYNSNYVLELKNREKYSPFAFNGSFIEEIKYRPLMEKAKKYNRIPGYIVKFNNGSYYAWNLKQLKRELIWYEKDLPHTTHFTSNNFKLKRVADLYLDEATKLI
jgi:hypothetical protein